MNSMRKKQADTNYYKVIPIKRLRRYKILKYR